MRTAVIESPNAEGDLADTAEEDPTGAHELLEDMAIAELEADGEKPATYRIVCERFAVTREAVTGAPLTSLKAARARLRRVTENGRCPDTHTIEKTNVLGVWETVAGRSARTTDRGLEIIIPALPNQQAPRYVKPDHGVEATVTDFFCGAGGSSSGMEMVPGVRVVMASNHWKLAIETHNYNLPHADHDQADLALVDPRRYPKTDFGWFSPECTKWSQAAGRPVDYDTKALQLTLDNMFDPDMQEDPDEPEAAEATRRSRALMGDVIRFSMYHQYKGVIVENVTDILQWAFLKDWLQKMVAEGYDYKIIVLNSAFANKLGAAPPQLRDRVYFMFWKRRYRKPNFAKWLRVKSWCDNCLQVVDGEYTAKPGKPRAMRYGQQYYYRCPKMSCRGKAARPFAQPASSVIDYTLPTQRIGDRTRPLRPKTRARVEAGLERWADHFLAALAGNTFERPGKEGTRTYPIGAPMPTQTTAHALGLVVPAGGTWNNTAVPTTAPLRATTTTENSALLVPTESRTGVTARPATEQLRAQTGRHQDALFQLDNQAPANLDGFTTVLRSRRPGAGEALVVPLRNNGVARPDADVLPTFAAGGTHHALLMRNNNTKGDQGYLSTPDTEPARAITTAGHQSVLEFEGLDGLYSYDTQLIRPANEPMPAQTTIEGDAVVRAASINVDDCTLRMLAVMEIQLGMAFPAWFQLLGKAKRNKVKMLGNAVTANAARDLMGCLFESITGIELQIVEFDPFRPIW